MGWVRFFEMHTYPVWLNDDVTNNSKDPLRLSFLKYSSKFCHLFRIKPIIWYNVFRDNKLLKFFTEYLFKNKNHSSKLVPIDSIQFKIKLWKTHSDELCEHTVKALQNNLVILKQSKCLFRFEKRIKLYFSWNITKGIAVY